MTAQAATSMRLSGLEGRIAAVTGASNGIGRTVAATLSALGCRVARIDLARDESPDSFAADVSDEHAVDRAFADIEQQLGPPELLVTCAGIFQPTPVAELGVDAWRRTLDVNLTGTFLCARRALPTMRANGFGRIVTISSGAGLDGGTEACAHYAASKGGVNALSKSLSNEVAREGVTVNVVAPRVVRTGMLAGEDEDGLVARIPVGRMGEPDDVAGAVAFLCSAHASYITGEVFVLNGGWW